MGLSLGEEDLRFEISCFRGKGEEMKSRSAVGMVMMMASLAALSAASFGLLSKPLDEQDKLEKREKRSGVREARATPRLVVDVAGGDYLEVIDLRTKKTVKRIKVGEHPHGLAVGWPVIFNETTGVSAETDFLYATVETSGQLVVANAETGEVVRKLKVGKTPNQLTLTRDFRFAYVPLREEASVAVVEFEETVEAMRWKKTTGERMATPRSEYYAKVVKRLPTGPEPHNAYTGARTGRVYVTSVKGQKIHVFDADKHEGLFEIELPGEPRPLALTRDESRAYVALSDFHGFIEVDLNAGKVLRRVELPALPPGTPAPYLKTYVHGLALSPDESELWVTSYAGGALYVYSVPELELKGKVAVGKSPHWLAWQPPLESQMQGWRLWVSEMDSNTVSVIDPDRREVIATLPTGPSPRRIVVLP
jgi:YVTN family beta-propeller protein